MVLASTRSVLALLFFLILAADQSTNAQKPQGKENGSESRGEKELTASQKASADAQTEYYRELTNKVRHPEQSTPRKTIRESLMENLAVVAALVVGFLTLVVNNRNTNRTLRDTQFYEALKRFGDQESPTLRSSAAGLLAQMGQTQRGRIRFQKTRPFVRWQKTYLGSAVDQLVTGLLLEQNPVALVSIKNALALLIPLTPNTVVSNLYTAHVTLQKEFASALAGHFVALGLKAVPPTSLDDLEQFTLWQSVGSLIGHHHSSVRDFVARDLNFSIVFDNIWQASAAKNSNGAGDLAATQEHVRDVWRRLRASIDLLSLALRHASGKRHEGFRGSFLGSVNLSDANLSHASFSNSYLPGAWFDGSNLTSVSFVDADLRAASFRGCVLRNSYFCRAKIDGTRFENADLTDANFSEVNVREVDRFHNSNWWKVDFNFSYPPKQTNTRLLEQLFERFGDSAPSESGDLHPSVRDYLQSKTAQTPETSL